MSLPINRLLLVLTSIVIALEVQAADLNRGQQTSGSKDWTGPYAGLSSGLMVTRTDWTFVAEQYRQKTERSAWGSQIGYRYQIDAFVAGLELAYNNRFDQHFAYSDSINSPDRNRRSRVAELWTIAAQGGYAYEGFLVYAFSGYVNGKVEFKTYITSTNDLSSFSNRWDNGWTHGGGVDFAATQSLSVGLQYKWTTLSTSSHRTTPMPGYAWGTVSGVSNKLASLMLRLNYSFK